METDQPNPLIMHLIGGLDMSSVQQTARLRVAEELALLGVAQQYPVTPETAWRCAWLQHRQTLLMPGVVGDDVVATLSFAHARTLRMFAAESRDKQDPEAPAEDLLARLSAASAGFWSALSAQLDSIGTNPRGWPDNDCQEFRWLRLCMVVLLAGRDGDGRPRSRRAVADVLASTQLIEGSVNTIRLKVLPRVKRYLEVADNWAALLNSTPI